MFDLIRDGVPSNEEKTKDQHDAEKGEGERDPFANSEFPPTIIQPMGRAFSSHSLGESRRKGAQFLDHRRNNLERFLDLRLGIVTTEGKANAATRTFVLKLHRAQNVR